jgi:hypothetical protein
MHLTCPHCGKRPERWLPVEPYHELSAVTKPLEHHAGLPTEMDLHRALPQGVPAGVSERSHQALAPDAARDDGAEDAGVALQEVVVVREVENITGRDRIRSRVPGPRPRCAPREAGSDLPSPNPYYY